MTDVYVAPAAKVLTVLHIPAGQDGEQRTRCGLPMAGDELWQPVRRQDGDRVCSFCATSAMADVASEALW